MKGKMTAVAGLTALTASSIGANSALAQGAEAENESSVGIEEIIVTARKREESLQEVPIAITAFTADALEKRSLTNLMEIGAFVPNVQMNTSPGGSGGGNNAQIYIRGIGQNDFIATTDPGVGIYVDGVYHPRTLGGVFDLLDLERIEVLRGPQGTLFGKNTIGGAVSLTSVRPTGEGGGYGQVTTGSFNRIDARASADVALSDNLFAKISFSSKDRDGYAKRLDFASGNVVDDQGDENQTATRLALRWLAPNNLEVNLIADYTREREASPPTTLVEVRNVGVTFLWNWLVGGPAGTPYDERYITGDPYTTYGTGPNVNELEQFGVALTLDKDFGGYAVKSISAYRQIEAISSRDGDGSPLSIIHTNQDDHQHQISQEIQVSGQAFDDRLDWVVGAFYFDEHNTDDNEVRLVSGLYYETDALTGVPGILIPALDIDIDVANVVDAESFAAFTHGSFQITDKLSFSAGLRYSWEEKVYGVEVFRINAGVYAVPPSVASDSWGAVSPKGSLNYQWSDQLLSYASISRGFKSGGFNGRPLIEAQIESFDPEFVTTYEVGFKSDWLDRRLRLNAAMFYNDYTDLQLGTLSADPATGNLILRLQNAGTAKITGFEVELQAQPVPRLNITASVGHTDFQFNELNAGVQDITLDTKPAKMPRWSSSASAEYTVPLNDFGNLIIRGDWTAQSKVFNDPLNEEAVAQTGFSIFNARVTLESDDNWELALFVTNIGDKVRKVGGVTTFASFGHAEAIYGRPREWGLAAKYRF